MLPGKFLTILQLVKQFNDRWGIKGLNASKSKSICFRNPDNNPDNKMLNLFLVGVEISGGIKKIFKIMDAFSRGMYNKNLPSKTGLPIHLLWTEEIEIFETKILRRCIQKSFVPLNSPYSKSYIYSHIYSYIIHL